MLIHWYSVEMMLDKNGFNTLKLNNVTINNGAFTVTGFAGASTIAGNLTVAISSTLAQGAFCLYIIRRFKDTFNHWFGNAWYFNSYKYRFCG